MSFYLCLLFAFISFLNFHSITALTRHNFYMPPKHTQANSKYVVQTSGKYSKNTLYIRAIKRAITAASIYWHSPRPLRLVIRYKKLLNGKLAKHKPQYVPLPDDSTVLIHRPAFATATNAETPPDKKPDGIIEINTSIKWHVGDDMPPNDRFDLSTVVLQQLYHNFMFSGNLKREHDKSNDKKLVLDDKTPSRFDTFVVNSFECPIIQKYRHDKHQLDYEMTRSSALSFFNSSFSLVPYSDSRSIENSVYYTTFIKDWTVTSSVLLPGQRSLVIPKSVLRMQQIYTDFNIKAPSTETCAKAQSSGEPGSATKTNNKTSKSKSKRITQILHVPIWAFGLCVVLLLIMLTLCAFCLCTMGALAKQREGANFVKRFVCCCTGVETAPIYGTQPEPVFSYIDTVTAKRYSLEAAAVKRRSSIEGMRNSIEGVVRNSIEYVRDRISSIPDIRRATEPTPPPPLVMDIEASHASLPAVAETVPPPGVMDIEASQASLPAVAETVPPPVVMDIEVSQASLPAVAETVLPGRQTNSDVQQQ